MISAGVAVPVVDGDPGHHIAEFGGFVRAAACGQAGRDACQHTVAGTYGIHFRGDVEARDRPYAVFVADEAAPFPPGEEERFLPHFPEPSGHFAGLFLRRVVRIGQTAQDGALSVVQFMDGIGILGVVVAAVGDEYRLRELLHDAAQPLPEARGMDAVYELFVDDEMADLFRQPADRLQQTVFGFGVQTVERAEVDTLQFAFAVDHLAVNMGIPLPGLDAYMAAVDSFAVEESEQLLAEAVVAHYAHRVDIADAQVDQVVGHVGGAPQRESHLADGPYGLACFQRQFGVFRVDPVIGVEAEIPDDRHLYVLQAFEVFFEIRNEHGMTVIGSVNVQESWSRAGPPCRRPMPCWVPDPFRRPAWSRSLCRRG